MKQMNLIFAALLFCFSNCQNNDPTKDYKETKDINKIHLNTVGYSDIYDKLPILTLDETNEEEYNELEISTSNFIEKGNRDKQNNITLETNNLILKVNNKKQENVWYEYLGFYTSINMYAISSNSVSEGIEFSDYELINKINGKITKIISPGDNKIENPVPSKNNKFLLYYYNFVYTDNNSFIGILSIDVNGDLKEYKSYASEKFKVFGIKWYNDNVFFIKTSSDDGKSFKYYKSNITIDNKTVTPNFIQKDTLYFDNDNIQDNAEILAKENPDFLNFVLSIHLSSLHKTVEIPVLNNSILYNNVRAAYYLSDPIIKNKVIELRIDYADHMTRKNMSGEKKGLTERFKIRFNPENKKIQIIGYDVRYSKEDKSKYIRSFNFITGKYYSSRDFNGKKKDISGLSSELQNVYVENWNDNFLHKLSIYGMDIK